LNLRSNKLLGVTPDPTAANIENPEIEPSTSSKRRSSDWDIRNAPGNYFSLVGFQAGSALFSFGAVWLITRHLGSEGYGGIVAIIAASQVAQVLVNWTSVAVVRFGVDEFIETEKIARTFWIRFIVLAANLILVLSLSTLWFPPLAGWLKLAPTSFWLVMTHFAVTVIWIHVQMSLQGAKLPRVQGFLQMIERLLIFGGLFALTAAANLTPFWAMLCYIAAPAAMACLGLYELQKYIFVRFSVDKPFVRKILAYSLPLLPFSLVGYFSGSYVDAAFVTKFLSIRDLGIYSVATQINGMALQLPTLANTLLLPLFITLQKEAGHHRMQNYFRNVLPSLILLWGLGCTVLAFVACFAVPLVFGAEFGAATLPLWILLAASVVGLPVAIGYSALSNATSTTYISMVAAVLSSATNIVGNFILIPQYGTAGCAFATVFAFFVGVTTFAVLLHRDAKMPVSWSYAAFAPCVVGTILFYLQHDAAFSLAVCIAASILMGYWFRHSLHKTILFVKNFRAR
jgi:O-antigen/teichoic acid export membrane protein